MLSSQLNLVNHLLFDSVWNLNMCRGLRILLVNPPSNCVDNDRLEPPLGLLYIAANLRHNKYENISILDMTGCINDQKAQDKISAIPEVDIYGITSLCTNYKHTKNLIRQIRSLNPSAYVVLGGANSSGIPDLVWNESGADAVVVGEGDITFKECVDSYTYGNVLKGILRGKQHKDINGYAFPARDFVDINAYSRRLMGQPVVSLISSRGCRYHCIHCNSVVMGGGSDTARYRSAQNVMKEIKTLRGKFEYYRFNDDHFTGNPDIEKLLYLITDLDIKFRVFARIEDLSEKTCRLLRKAGCMHISLGLESLSPENLRILGKAKQIGKEGNIKIAQSYGITTRASFMVGLPYDTDDTIEEYFYKALRLGLDEFAVYPLIPYPGTMIWKYPQKFGYTITNMNFEDYVQMGKNGRTCYALQHENFGPKDVEIWKLKAEQILKSGGVQHMRESEVAG